MEDITETPQICDNSQASKVRGRTEPNKIQTVLLVIFAWLGVTINFAVRAYPSGFYLEFLQVNNMNKTFGTFMVSLTQITQLLSPYMSKRIKWLQRITLKTRCLLYSVLGAVSILLLTVVDEMTGWDKSGMTVLIFIGLGRALQGSIAGLHYVLFQGQIIDAYFKGNKVVAGIISSGIFSGCISGIICAGRLYDQGGWTLLSPVIACFYLFPLIFLPFIPLSHEQLNIESVNNLEIEERLNKSYIIENKAKECDRKPSIGSCRSSNGRNRKLSITSEPETENQTENTLKETTLNTTSVIYRLSNIQKVAYFIPDVVTFLDNLLYIILIFVIPHRLVNFNDMTLDRAVVIMNLISVVSMVCSIVSIFLLKLQVDTILVILAGIIFAYTGVLCMYGSTTITFLSFRYSFEVGSVLLAVGEAAILNICIPSKFDLLKKWKISLMNSDVTEEASNILNYVFSISTVIGTVLSSFVGTRSSEIPTLIFFLTLFAIAFGATMISKVFLV